MAIDGLKPQPEVRPNRRLRSMGFVAFLDVIFASIGVFIAVIVIQATMVQNAKAPSEADIYATLTVEGKVIDRIAAIEPWLKMEMGGDGSESTILVWTERLKELAFAVGRPVLVELYVASDALDAHRSLETALFRSASQGDGPGGVPTQIVVWRPLRSGIDAVGFLESKALDEAVTDEK